MIHFTCDACGKELPANEPDRFVVKMELFASRDPRELIEEDLEDDHLEEVSQLLQENPDSIDLPPSTQHFRFDLCPECRRRFAEDPLGKKRLVSLFSSEN